MRKRSVIFDLDGTLIDSADSILDSITHALEASNMDAVVPINRCLIGPPLMEVLARVTGVSVKSQLSPLAESFCGYYDQTGYKRSVVYPGINELLDDFIALGFRLYIATNKRARPTKKILEHLGWNPIFSAIINIDCLDGEFFASKTEMLSALLKRESLDVDAAVYVGDRIEDYVAASTNHLSCILVDWGYEAKSLIRTQPCISVTSPGDLKTTVRRML
jgi:phosphoglycolate phosphatase